MEENVKKPAGGLGVAALVLGIISLVFCWIAVISIICGLVGIILGIIAIVQKRKLAMPLIGSILSFFGIIASIVIVLLVTGLIMKAVDEFDYNDIVNEPVYTNSLYKNNESKNNSYNSNSLFNSTYNNTNKNNTSSNTSTNNILSSDTHSKSSEKVSGYSYVEKNDNSLLDLNSNGSFKYYKNKDVLNDYYYEGKYEVYTGSSLKNWIQTYGGDSVMSSYKTVFDNYTDSQWNSMYLLVLNNSKQIVNGENVMNSPVTSYYFGTYEDSSKTLSVVNLKSAETYNFVKK